MESPTAQAYSKLQMKRSFYGILLALSVVDSLQLQRILPRRCRPRLCGISQPTGGFSPAIRRYFLLRHGQTDLNAAGVVQGSSDVSRLTDLGRQQAREAGEGLAKVMRESTHYPDMPLAAVFSSNVTRAMETLDQIRVSWKHVGRNDFGSSSAYVSVLPDLREIDLFEWEVFMLTCEQFFNVVDAHKNLLVCCFPVAGSEQEGSRQGLARSLGAMGPGPSPLYPARVGPHACRRPVAASRGRLARGSLV